MENKKIGFTLIELIVVLAIIGVLVGILIAVIKPQEIFARLRDTQRQADLNSLANAIKAYITEFAQNPSTIVLTADVGGTNGCVGGASSTVYYSANTQPPTPPTGFSRTRATTSKAVDGQGWLPVLFASATILNLTTLPIDPRNSNYNANPSFYYTYACKTDLGFELDANLETTIYAEQNDGGDNPNLYEVGINKNLLPSSTSAVFYPNP